MKKIIALALAFILVLPFAACKSSDQPSSPSQEGDINATVIWRAFDDQYQSGFRIIMQSEVDKMTGIKLDMQDGENDVSKTTNKLETSLTKGTNAVAICAPDQECTNSLMLKCKDENVPVVFFNMMPYRSPRSWWILVWQDWQRLMRLSLA